MDSWSKRCLGGREKGHAPTNTPDAPQATPTSPSSGQVTRGPFRDEQTTAWRPEGTRPQSRGCTPPLPRVAVGSKAGRPSQGSGLPTAGRGCCGSTLRTAGTKQGHPERKAEGGEERKHRFWEGTCEDHEPCGYTAGAQAMHRARASGYERGEENRHQEQNYQVSWRSSTRLGVAREQSDPRPLGLALTARCPTMAIASPGPRARKPGSREGETAPTSPLSRWAWPGLPAALSELLGHWGVWWVCDTAGLWALLTRPGCGNCPCQEEAGGRNSRGEPVSRQVQRPPRATRPALTSRSWRCTRTPARHSGCRTLCSPSLPGTAFRPRSPVWLLPCTSPQGLDPRPSGLGCPTGWLGPATRVHPPPPAATNPAAMHLGLGTAGDGAEGAYLTWLSCARTSCLRSTGSAQPRPQSGS